MRRRLALALLLPVLALGACSDDDGGAVDAGVDDPPADAGGVPAATFEGTITQVTEFEPIEGDCVPADQLDPDGSVSSDDPPICSDPATVPLGSILVASPDGDQIVFTIRQDTELTGGGAPITFDDLAADQEVKVGFSGQVAESFPGQASADAVDVTG